MGQVLTTQEENQDQPTKIPKLERYFNWYDLQQDYMLLNTNYYSKQKERELAENLLKGNTDFVLYMLTYWRKTCIYEARDVISEANYKYNLSEDKHKFLHRQNDWSEPEVKKLSGLVINQITKMCLGKPNYKNISRKNIKRLKKIGFNMEKKHYYELIEKCNYRISDYEDLERLLIGTLVRKTILNILGLRESLAFSKVMLPQSQPQTL